MKFVEKINRVFDSFGRRFLAVSGLLLVLGGVTYLIFSLEDQSSPAVAPLARTLHYRFSIVNQTNHSVTEAAFFAFAPITSSPYQDCLRITASLPFSLEKDSKGNRFIRFDLQRMAPFAQQEIRVTANLDMFAAPRRGTSQPEKEAFLSPSENIEVGAEEIVRRAHLLASEGGEDAVKRIFDWVVGHVRYSGASGKDRGALHVLRSGEGDCTDMALLFTALCRAAGIPCRTVGGFICDRNMNLAAASYHNWGEFYSGGQWWVGDVANNNFKPSGANYVVFHVYGDGGNERFQRFRLVGQGLKARMK
jgi:transglutaminase-like putative cysteine protease